MTHEHEMDESEGAAQLAGFDSRFGSNALADEGFTAEELRWFAKGYYWGSADENPAETLDLS